MSSFLLFLSLMLHILFFSLSPISLFLFLCQKLNDTAHGGYTDLDALLCFPVLTVLFQGGMRECFQLSMQPRSQRSQFLRRTSWDRLGQQIPLLSPLSN